LENNETVVEILEIRLLLKETKTKKKKKTSTLNITKEGGKIKA
jgi:hypothetical protein